MTIEQKAREIAERMAPAGDVWDADVERISLGIIEGLEMAAQIIDQCNREGPYEAIGGAKRIRALIEEQKVTKPIPQPRRKPSPEKDLK